MENIYADIPEATEKELVQTLLKKDRLRIERIVSRGHATAEGEWYDQPWDEWVLLVKGKATLVFEDGMRVEMKSGDYLWLPAHDRHRVEWTDPGRDSVWLAIHIEEPA
ncbi:MAG: cupin domain-containing protein [Gammaproteobacteria bacterium]